jgi:hypothetical protein
MVKKVGLSSMSMYTVEREEKKQSNLLPKLVENRKKELGMNRIKQGDVVTLKYVEKPFLNSEFKKWLRDHLDKRFYVEKATERSVKLSKVNFAITTEFIVKGE